MAATSGSPTPTWKDQKIWDELREKVAAKAGANRLELVNTWYSRMIDAYDKSSSFEIWYYVLVLVTSLLAAAVPALIAFTTTTDKTTANVLRIVAAAIGVVVAVATAVTGVVQLGNRWRVYRGYAFTLEEAGWTYLAAADNDKGYGVFAKAVADARRIFIRTYLSEIAALRSGGN
jgi:hypothetical protein